MSARHLRLYQVDPEIFLPEEETAPCRSRNSDECGFDLIVCDGAPVQIISHGHTSGAALRPCHPRIGPLYRATPDFPPGVARCFQASPRNSGRSDTELQRSRDCGKHLTDSDGYLYSILQQGPIIGATFLSERY
jgi:hypothetical protein